MRKFSKNFKNLTIIIILFIAFFIINAHSYAINVSNGLSSNIFRLHILANSDSEEDQALKLKVRDAILQYMETLNTAKQDKQSVIELSKQHIEDFKMNAEKVIHENGYDYYAAYDGLFRAHLHGGIYSLYYNQLDDDSAYKSCV